MNQAFIILALGILGLCFGSFVNAWVWRIKTGRSVAKGRSMCPNCKHQLEARDLIPVVSWLMLKGKCRYCKKPYDDSPLVEIGVMAYFVLSFLLWSHDLTNSYQILQFGFWLLTGVLLAVLFVYDLKWQLLPDKIVKPLIVLGIVWALITQLHVSDSFTTASLNILYSLLPITGVYWLLYIVSGGRWVGLGDVKLGIFLGLALGWQKALVCLVAANFIGLLFVAPGLLSGRLKRTSRVPFGPFLILGFIVAGLFGDQIISWYVSQLILGGLTS